MKVCNRCNSTYDDKVDFCFRDGTPLVVVEGADAPPAAEPPVASRAARAPLPADPVDVPEPKVRRPLDRPSVADMLDLPEPGYRPPRRPGRRDVEVLSPPAPLEPTAGQVLLPPADELEEDRGGADVPEPTGRQNDAYDEGLDAPTPIGGPLAVEEPDAPQADLDAMQGEIPPSAEAVEPPELDTAGDFPPGLEEIPEPQDDLAAAYADEPAPRKSNSMVVGLLVAAVLLVVGGVAAVKAFTGGRHSEKAASAVAEANPPPPVMPEPARPEAPPASAPAEPSAASSPRAGPVLAGAAPSEPSAFASAQRAPVRSTPTHAEGARSAAAASAPEGTKSAPAPAPEGTKSGSAAPERTSSGSAGSAPEGASSGSAGSGPEGTKSASAIRAAGGGGTHAPVASPSSARRTDSSGGGKSSGSAAGAATPAAAEGSDVSADPWAAAAGAATAAASGRLTVTSIPSGATVYVDNKPAGHTPSSVDVAYGKHTVRVEMAGYKPSARTVDVQVPEMAVPFELRPLVVTGQVNIFGPVGAVVYVDGRSVGKMPATAQLSEGTHIFKVEGTDGKSFTQTREIKFDASGRPVTVSLQSQ